MKSEEQIEDFYTPDVLDELKIALDEVGSIQPVWQEEVSAWVFTHPLYPTVEVPGDTEEDCRNRYPWWLAQFIKERLKDNISEADERITSGRGGKRSGSGRPRGRRKPETEAIRVPIDIAQWLKAQPEHWEQVRKIMG